MLEGGKGDEEAERRDKKIDVFFMLVVDNGS